MPENYNRSVWIEQFDSALLSFLKTKIKIKNKEISFSITKPEESLKERPYPSVSVTLTGGPTMDVERYGQGPVRTLLDKENLVGNWEEPAMPFKVFYRIDFWAKLQTHLNEMTKCWYIANKDPRIFLLPTVDAGGEERITTCFIKNATPLNEINGTERIFRLAINLEGWIEIDEGITYTEGVIGNARVNTHLNSNTKGG